MRRVTARANVVAFLVVDGGVLGSASRDHGEVEIMALPADLRGHTAATRSPLPDVARQLEDVLGQRMTAVIAGIADAKAVGKWARGERFPRPDAEQRLRDAYYVTTLLLQAESPATVRAWFMGMNPELDDRAPALVLGEDAARVLQAARTFLAHS
jgi:hypothetical protein